MVNKFLLTACLLLAACNGDPMRYEYAQSNVTIYRPYKSSQGETPFPISINSKPVCKLKNGGYFVSHMVNPATISASKSGKAARINVTPPAYLKVEVNKASIRKRGLDGLLTSGIMETAREVPPPYIFTLVKPEQAKEELKELSENCRAQ